MAVLLALRITILPPTIIRIEQIVMRRISFIAITIFALLLGGYGIFYSSVSAQEKIENIHRNDVVAQLQRRLESGAAQLEYKEGSGYLESVLKLLNVPVSSQSLVFSRTSLQVNHISPSNPRAIFFNDNVYVGWIRGAELIELTAIDPKLGASLYVIEQKKSAQPKFMRGVGCAGCHGSGNTRFVQGHLLRSVLPDASSNTFLTDHTSPYADRWGGWYVTAKKLQEPHLGNIVFGDTSKVVNPDDLPNKNLERLDNRVDLTGYQSPHSDIVALMVLAHQTQMQNLIMWLAFETQMAMHEEQEATKNTDKPLAEWTHGARHRVRYAADEVLKYLLFVEEAKLSAPVIGTTNFAQEFSAPGVRDKQGRSLRDLDLQQRLLRYPCSYYIYSDAFDNLPKPALDYLYRRLWLILNGQDNDKNFASLSTKERNEILEILVATKPNLPDYFRAASKLQTNVFPQSHTK